MSEPIQVCVCGHGSHAHNAAGCIESRLVLGRCECDGFTQADWEAPSPPEPRPAVPAEGAGGEARKILAEATGVESLLLSLMDLLKQPRFRGENISMSRQAGKTAIETCERALDCLDAATDALVRLSSEVAALREENARLRGALQVARVRFALLQDRMEACAEEPQDHDLSVREIDGWCNEIADLLGGRHGVAR